MHRLLLAIALIWPSLACADITGRVVAVHDGDTITVLTPDKHQVKVRAADIDAPELRQAFGTQSRQAMAALVFGKQVRITHEHGDRYGRQVGEIGVGKLNANEEMVKQGMAWVYVQYNTNPALPLMQEQALELRLGLWADPHPVAPWLFRHPKKDN